MCCDQRPSGSTPERSERGVSLRLGKPIGPVFGGMSAMPQDGIGIRGKHRRSRHAGLSVHLNNMQSAAVESKG
jgi:hypothetical protein